MDLPLGHGPIGPAHVEVDMLIDMLAGDVYRKAQDVPVANNWNRWGGDNTLP